MPGLNELDQLSKSYGLAIAILIIAAMMLIYALVTLWRENRQITARLESVLAERGKALEQLLNEALREKRDRSLVS